MAVSRYIRAVTIWYMSHDIMCNKCIFFSGLFFHTPLGLSTVCQLQVVRLKTWPSSVTETTVCTEEVILRVFTTPTLYVTYCVVHIELQVHDCVMWADESSAYRSWKKISDS